MESCPPWLRFREGGNELSLTGSSPPSEPPPPPPFSLTPFFVFINMKGEMEGGGRGGEELNEGYKSRSWRWGQAGTLLCCTSFWLVLVNKKWKKLYLFFFLLFLIDLFLLIPSHLPLAVFPLLIIAVCLDTLFSLPSGCRIFGPSCCCFYTQDCSMNPGAFSSSGPLSWAMYLMRKGRTGGGLFGKAYYSWHLIVIITWSCHATCVLLLRWTCCSSVFFLSRIPFCAVETLPSHNLWPWLSYNPCSFLYPKLHILYSCSTLHNRDLLCRKIL